MEILGFPDLALYEGWDLRDIGRLRKSLGLTQSQLAKMVGVSQSLIAKIERGKINPSFGVVKRIFSVLMEIQAKKNEVITAKEICTRELISVNVDDSILKAVEQMRRHDISQLPVFNGGIVVGSVSEATVIKKIDKIKPSSPVKEIMDDPFPIVPENTSLSVIKCILLEHNAVLVQRRGEIIGIITKADILRVVERRS